MATKEPKKELKKPRTQPAETESAAEGAAPARRRRRWLKLLAVPLVPALLVWSAPMIVAHTGLRNLILQRVVRPQGTIACGSATFGWFTAPVLNNLEVHDADGNSVLEVETVSSDRSLLALAMNHSDLGEIDIVHPVVHVVSRQDGSNVEDVFTTAEDHAESHARPDTTVKVQLTDGVVTIEDAVSQRQFQLENLAVTLSLGDADNPLVVEGSATMPTEARPASFKVALRASRLEGSIPQAGEASCQMESLPLIVVQPFLGRMLPGAKIDGRVSSNLQSKWGGGAGGDEGLLSGELTISGLRLAADALGEDELHVERLRMPCQISQAGEILKFDQCEIDSELGQLSINGTARMRDFSAADLVSSLTHENYQVKGQIDLARVAQILPHTLRVREGTEITSGRLAIAMNSGPDRAGTAWSGRLEASDLSGRADGRQVTWEKPLVMDFLVTDGRNGPVIEKASCVSSFLAVDASGTFDDLSATAQYDLGRLVGELSQFLDLTAFQLGGQGTARLSWRRAADGGCRGHGDFETERFQFVVPGRRPWQEAKLSVQVDLAGTLDGGSLQQIQTASLQLSSPNERLTAKLADPVSDVSKGVWPVQISWQGQLADWLPRIESWVSLQGWDLAGSGDVQALVYYSPTKTEISQSKISLDKFHLWGHGLYIDEPRLDASSAAKWDSDAGQFSSAETSFAAGSVQLKLKDAHFETIAPASDDSKAVGGIVARGAASYQADLGHLGRWLQDPRAKATWSLAGRLSGQADVTTKGGVTKANVDSQIDGLEVADLSPAATRANARGTAWREQKLSFNFNGTYDGAADVLTVAQGQIDSDALRCQAAGQITAVSGNRGADLKGKLDYDWDALAPFWRLYVPDGTKISGKGTREFYVRGPCPSAANPNAWGQLVAEAGLDWSSAEIYGLRISQGEISGKLTGGIVQIKPLDLDVNGGRVQLLSQLQLAPSPMKLLLAKGPLVHEVAMSPEVCAQGLKFVAPIVADATVAEGKFSIDLDGARLPIADPAAGDLAGHLVVHSVQVKAGGMAEQLISLGKEIAAVAQSRTPGDAASTTLLTMSNQTVDFRLVNRRVYHRGIQFIAGTTPITTFGSVGLDDESLEIMAEVPIPGTGTNGAQPQTLQIPIEGTLKNPRIDRRAIPQLAGKMLEGKAKGAILDKVNKGLDKLLPIQR